MEFVHDLIGINDNDRMIEHLIDVACDAPMRSEECIGNA